MTSSKSIEPSTPCPLLARGLVLRPLCEGCSGRPATGQLVMERGDVLARHGEPAEHVFAVVEGWVRESIVGADGRRTTTRFVGPGNILASEALANGTHRVSLDALHAARVCRAPARHVALAMTSRPRLAMALTDALTDDLEALRERIVRSTLPARERVLCMLGELLGDTPNGVWCTLPATREDMADALGLTLETVSRQVQELHREGVIEVHGRKVRRPAGPPSEGARDAFAKAAERLPSNKFTED